MRLVVVLFFIYAISAVAVASEPGIDCSSVGVGTIRTVDIGSGIKMDFVWCPPGSFMMGSTPAQQEKAIHDLPAGLSDHTVQTTKAAIHAEGPPHRITFTRGFWMGRTEVTQSHWQQIMGNNPSHFADSGMDAPVETVSWNDCMVFIDRLNQLPEIRKTGRFRLPSEVEWEYVCRAGTQSAYHFGEDASRLGDYAWFAGNSGMKTYPVAQKLPNAWGFYDMHGNVWEWCMDFFAPYTSSDQVDPVGISEGQGHVGRGGGWDDFASDLRAAYRSFGRPADFRASPLGVRLVMTDSY
jgi:formylglycine-generating enzyme required for sulfatase activity